MTLKAISAAAAMLALGIASCAHTGGYGSSSGGSSASGSSGSSTAPSAFNSDEPLRYSTRCAGMSGLDLRYCEQAQLGTNSAPSPASAGAVPAGSKSRNPESRY